MTIKASMIRLGRRGKSLRGVLATLSLVLAVACGGDKATNPVEPPKPDDPAIRIQNSSASTVSEVYYSNCASDSFGDDRLSGTIAPGASQTFTTDVTSGCFDILVVSSTGLEAPFSGRQVEGTLTVTVTNF